ncbi:cytochrome P450 [Kitasatospora sp. NPDC058444]|uniref:cytochrome P450 n=1 Tax=Kitasatospora sp. NPDC058444 TaxID=3346504 RepID=UPI0036623122
MAADLTGAGFAGEDEQELTLQGRAASTADLATGYPTGTPVRAAVEEHGDGPAVRATVIEEMTARQGAGPVTAPMTTSVFRAAAWFLTRTVTRDTSLGGYPLPAGSGLVYSPYLLHHRPDLHADPETFDPDRCTPDRPQPPRDAFIPFATGARKCIGDTFATTEATLALATIAARRRRTPARPPAAPPSEPPTDRATSGCGPHPGRSPGVTTGSGRDGLPLPGQPVRQARPGRAISKPHDFG